MTKVALILCSGGLDSAVLVNYVKKKLNYSRAVILFFDYGQLASQAEEKASRYLAKSLKMEFVKIRVPRISNQKKAKHSNNLRDTRKESDAWYFPFRNTIFISHAVSLAESLGKADIFLGFKCEGKESYPDTTKAYVKEMNKLVNKATGKKVIRILAPFIEMDKEDIILLGNKLEVEFEKTISCYCSNVSCGRCLACRLRKAGFYWANIPDPTIYSKR